MNPPSRTLSLAMILCLSAAGLLIARLDTATAEPRDGSAMFRPAGNATADPPILALVPRSNPSPSRGPIIVELHITGAANVGAFEAVLVFDPAFVQVTDMAVQPFLGVTAGCDPGTERCAMPLGPTDTVDGLRIAVATYGAGAGTNGDGVLASLYLQPTGALGTTALGFQDAILGDVYGKAIIPVTQDGTLEIQSVVYLPTLPKK
jgi:hypothetical protein